jgi:hypothetical protein
MANTANATREIWARQLTRLTRTEFDGFAIGEKRAGVGEVGKADRKTRGDKRVTISARDSD